MTLRASHMGHNIPIYSHSEDLVSQASMCVIPLLWQHVGLDFSHGRQSVQNRPTYSLNNDSSFPKHVCYFQVIVVFQTLHREKVLANNAPENKCSVTQNQSLHWTHPLLLQTLPRHGKSILSSKGKSEEPSL